MNQIEQVICVCCPYGSDKNARNDLMQFVGNLIEEDPVGFCKLPNKEKIKYGGNIESKFYNKIVYTLRRKSKHIDLNNWTNELRVYMGHESFKDWEVFIIQLGIQVPNGPLLNTLDDLFDFVRTDLWQRLLTTFRPQSWPPKPRKLSSAA